MPEVEAFISVAKQTQLAQGTSRFSSDSETIWRLFMRNAFKARTYISTANKAFEFERRFFKKH
ncbi:hypothetical protein [Paraburkholderia caledonica]|jgi:hypothetical protein|uniref:hypothetical protein n=1 Tax=Paraburkholderia caledonica TaxID=134536 RepID=UPI0038B85211